MQLVTKFLVACQSVLTCLVRRLLIALEISRARPQTRPPINGKTEDDWHTICRPMSTNFETLQNVLDEACCGGLRTFVVWSKSEAARL
jgi:hypothetical protein